MYKFLALISIVLLSGCTDADRGKLGAIGKDGHIQCWSGDHKFYDGYSTGVVHTEETTDGWYFVEKSTNEFIRISGNCLIRN